MNTTRNFRCKEHQHPNGEIKTLGYRPELQRCVVCGVSPAELCQDDGAVRAWELAQKWEPGWVQLKSGNDWGVTYFAIEPLRNGSANAARGIKLTEGESVRIRMSDGTEVDGWVTLKEEHGMVSDHGHSYGTTSVIPRVGFMLHGQVVSAQIDELQVQELWARERGAQ